MLASFRRVLLMDLLSLTFHPYFLLPYLISSDLNRFFTMCSVRCGRNSLQIYAHLWPLLSTACSIVTSYSSSHSPLSKWKSTVFWSSLNDYTTAPDTVCHFCRNDSSRARKGDGRPRSTYQTGFYFCFKVELL
jgi:hypothetical protein